MLFPRGRVRDDHGLMSTAGHESVRDRSTVRNVIPPILQLFGWRTHCELIAVGRTKAPLTVYNNGVSQAFRR